MFLDQQNKSRKKSNNSKTQNHPSTRDEDEDEDDEEAAEEEDDTQFIFGAVNTVLKVGTPSAMPTPSKPVYKPVGAVPFDITNIPTTVNSNPVVTATEAASAPKTSNRFSNVTVSAQPTDFPFVDAAEVQALFARGYRIVGNFDVLRLKAAVAETVAAVRGG